MTTTLKQRAKLFCDMEKGGYMQAYEILDGDKVVGSKSVYRKNSSSEVIVVYFLDDLEFDNARDFIAAYQKGSR